MPEQLDEEVEKLIVFSLDMLKHFGFEDFLIYVSTKPQDSVGKTRTGKTPRKPWPRACKAGLTL